MYVISITAETQTIMDSNGVKRHYSTGDMLNERDELDTRRPKSEGFNNSYRLQQLSSKKRYSFGVSVTKGVSILLLLQKNCFIFLNGRIHMEVLIIFKQEIVFTVETFAMNDPFYWTTD